MLPALSRHKRMNLEDIGTLQGSLRTRNTVFIGRKARITQVEIVFEVMMSTDEQEQIAAGG
jgi:hypothetical protein